MGGSNKRRILLSGPVGIIWISLLFGMLYWVFECVIDVLIFYEGSSAAKLLSQGGTFTQRLSNRLLYPTPNEAWMRSLAMFVFILFGVYIHSTITKHRQAQKELKRVQDEIAAKDMRETKRLMQKEKELAVAEAAAAAERKRAAELTKAYKDLGEVRNMLIQAEKLDAVGRLASGVAHEVKTPLGVIIQGVSYLDRHVPRDKEVLEVLNMIKNNVKRADEIVRTLVDFSRAAKLELSYHDINSILEDSLGLIQHEVKLESIEIVREMEGNLPRALVDKGKMEQVFVNIFLNSIQAMPSGGKIFVRSYLTRLEEMRGGVGRRSGDRFNYGEAAIMVEIEDKGKGMPADDVKKAFDPFFTTKGPGEGTGLGLSISKNIIDMHSGIIGIESEKGKRTKVTVTLKIHGGRGHGKKEGTDR
ncbi:sensor histidine kinase [Candidatus Omnitrophota bacterium]